MKRDQKLGFFGLFIVSFFLVSPVFQNCSKVGFRSAANESIVKVEPLSTRTITVDPTYNQEKADMKVLLVVDDSYTMSQSQTQLANAIDSLLNPLQGHNVEFKIVSTSGVPNNEVDYSITKKYFSDQNIEISSSQLEGLSGYFVDNNIKNASSNRHGLLKLYRESTTAQFQNLKQQIKTAIQAVGVAGSDTEEGLCATARQIFDDSDSGFFKVGDKAAIVLLTDENDSSFFSRCSSRYRQRISSQSVVYYNYGQQRAKISLEYQVTNDGVTTWQPVVWGVSLSGPRTISVGANCTPEDQVDSVTKITSQGFVVRNVKNCVYEVIAASYYGADLGDDGSSDRNLCTQSFSYNGKTYANLYAMINANTLSAAAESCGRQIIPGNQLSGQIEFDSIVRSDPAAYSSQDLKVALLNKSNNVFGPSGYIYASLIRVSGESCALSSGQSYGTKYQELNSLLGPQRSAVQSLCNSDFSSVLTQVSQFIVNVVSNSYVLPLQDGESVLSVSILRNQDKISLTKSDYEVVQNTITLKNFTLLQGDVLEFELGPQ